MSDQPENSGKMTENDPKKANDINTQAGEIDPKAPTFFAENGVQIVGETPQIVALFTALSKAQSEFPEVIEKNKKVEVKKDGRTLYSFDYADMGIINRATKKALTKHGLSVLQPPVRSARSLGVYTLVTHSGGGMLASFFQLEQGRSLQDDGGNLTYAQRYGYSKTLGLATDEDADDMTAKFEAEKEKDKPKQRRRQAPKPQQPAPQDDRPPPPDDSDAPSEAAPEASSKRPSARRPKKEAPDLDEKKARLKELRTGLGMTPKQTAELMLEVSKLDPRNEELTAEAADLTIARLEAMQREAG